MHKKITEEHIAFMEGRYHAGLSYTQIAMELVKAFDITISSDTVRYFVTRKKKKKKSYREKLKDSGMEKVLVLSDIHIPFQREDILDIVAKHKHEISTIILGGDTVDCYAVSSFSHLETNPLVYEMKETHELLKQIQNVTPGIRKYMIVGNHEQRWSNYIAKNASELNTLHSENILNEIVGGFSWHDRVKGVTTQYEALDYIVIDKWYMNYHDMIVAHPLNFSKVAAKTSSMALDYFVEHGEDFNVALIAHTHKISSCFKYGKLAVEIGSLCKEQEYANKGKLSYTQQLNGYHLAVFKNKKYQVNESRQILLNT